MKNFMVEMTVQGGTKMTNQANQPQIVEFRQTFNMYTKQWCTPKKKVGDKWVPINNLKHVVSKKSGITYALWRLRDLMATLKCTTHNQRVWNCSKVTGTKRGIYTIYHLTCNRFKHSISGVM